MTANTQKSRARQVGEGFLTFIILIFIFGLFIGDGSDEASNSGPKPQQVMTLAGTTLADYAALSADDRRARVAYMTGQAGAPRSDVPQFVACMGAHAVNKNTDLDAADVFGWCDVDRTQNPETFKAHFNELDAPDLTSMATVMCRNAIRARLRDPASADFPWVPDQRQYLQRHTYRIASHLDAANRLGGTERLSYSCDVRYTGAGSTSDEASWELIALTVE